MKVEQSTLLNSLKNNNVHSKEQGIQEFLTDNRAEGAFQGAFTTDIKGKASDTKVIQGKDLTYQNPLKDKEERGLKEELEEGALVDTMTKHNQMAVLANTVSPEDLQKISEEGYAFASMDPSEMVTVVDRIKVNMAKTGADVDLSDMNDETLEKLVGSQVMVEKIMDQLEDSDLPATKANVSDTEKALEELASIEQITEQGMAYLLKNDLEVNIDNIYLASHSGNTEAVVEKEEAAGEYSELEDQILFFLEEQNLETSEESIRDAKWLLANDIPLTKENVEKLQMLEQIGAQFEENGGVSFGEAMKAITQTIQAGKRPGQTPLFEITSQRKREENRLQMTADANLSSLVSKKNGLGPVDLKPIEEEVNQLKQKEESYYEKLLKESFVSKDSKEEGPLQDINLEDSQVIKEKAALQVETRWALEEIKAAPAYVLTEIAYAKESPSLDQVRDAGNILADNLKKAGQAYETLMTAPRKDLGDSIQKAFQNVDDILKDLELDTTESNRRAVRILAYNELAIDKESVETVKMADQEMQRTFKNLTPAVTLEMIRRNQNPLEMNLQELNEKAIEIKEALGVSEERFSKFLWKLEHRKEITEEERESFIGIYRLITQVEKADGAALGSLLNQGGQMTMKNLLTATRNRKKAGMDYKVDDAFAGVDKVEKGTAIDQQINKAFLYQKNCLEDIAEELDDRTVRQIHAMDWEEMTPSQIKENLDAENTENQNKEAQGIEAETMADSNVEDLAYAKENLEAFEKMVNTKEEVYRILDNYDMPASPINLLAAAEMLRNPNAMFESLFEKNRKSKSNIEMVEDLKNQVLEEFGDALKNPEDLAKAQDVLADVAENVMKTMILEEEKISSLDIRELQKMCQQFTLAAKKTKEESFVIPIETPDGISPVSLKIVRGSEEKGWVDILFRGEAMGKIAASFQAKEHAVSGMIAVDTQETRQLLSENLSMIAGIFQEDGGEAIDMSIAYLPDMDYEKALRNQYKVNEAVSEERKESESYKVQTTRLYHIAESFISALKELNDDGSFGSFF